MIARRFKATFGDGQVEIESAENGLLDIGRLLAHRDDFHGSTQVNYLIHFGNLFVPLIGVDKQKFKASNIVILEEYYEEARQLMVGINTLAQKLIKHPELYDDVAFCRDYYELAKEGYDLLAKHEDEFRIPSGIPVSLERAGLVATRLAAGVGQNSRITGELSVITKRTHLKDEPKSFLSATVKWRSSDEMAPAAGQNIVVNDFVNPASGASTAALLLASQAEGFKPKAIVHRSINATRQGIALMDSAIRGLGIEPYFYSVGAADTLDENYYLGGRRAVGDAGHALRHFLPNWYKS